VKAAGEGTVDIGMSSRDLKDEEEASYPALVKHEIAYDAILIIVNDANPIEHLTLDQIRGIYNGTYTNWNQVGGVNQPVVVVGRDSASGTREYFAEAVMKKENFTPKQEEFNSNGGIQIKVQQTPGAIGYVGLAFTENVKVVLIDVNGIPVEPTLDNVVKGSYPISRPLFLLTKGQPAGLAKTFIHFILSTDGQKIVEGAGFVPLP
jgi:phosphate transport system substrate-binding protein